MRAARSSARRKTSSFVSSSSTTASISRSASTRSSTGVDAREHVVGRAPPFSASRSRLLRIAASPRSIAPGNGSCSDTRRPDAATTCAIPPPICPAPTTRTCSNSTRGGYNAAGTASLGRRRRSTRRGRERATQRRRGRERPAPCKAAAVRRVREAPVRGVHRQPRPAALERTASERSPSPSTSFALVSGA